MSCLVVSLPHDHPQVGPVESLPLPQKLVSLHLEVISGSVQCHIKKMILRKPRFLMTPTRNEMEYVVGPFRSQQVGPV